MIDTSQINELTKDIVVKAIVAVGLDGQIGLNGNLPWKGIPELTEITVTDLSNFKKLTTDCVVVVGRNTWSSVSHLDRTCNRRFLIDGADTLFYNEDSKRNEEIPWDFWIPKYIALKRFERDEGKDVVWIAGGAKTYKKWLPYLDELHMFELPYDGPADTYLPEEMKPENIDPRRTNVFLTSYF